MLKLETIKIDLYLISSNVRPFVCRFVPRVSKTGFKNTTEPYHAVMNYYKTRSLIIHF